MDIVAVLNSLSIGDLRTLARENGIDAQSKSKLTGFVGRGKGSGVNERHRLIRGLLFKRVKGGGQLGADPRQSGAGPRQSGAGLEELDPYVMSQLGETLSSRDLQSLASVNKKMAETGKSGVVRKTIENKKRKELEEITEWINAIPFPGREQLTPEQVEGLRELHLYVYDWTSSVPESIGRLENLQKLFLYFNELTSLPESIGQLKNLRNLFLRDIELKSLPESIGGLQALQELDLERNRLTSLPESIGQLRNLQKLNLYNNRLTSLPESIGKLKKLQELYLGNNRLTSLPESIGGLQALHMLDLSGTKLTSLPESLKKRKDITIYR
jgi:hypothetical protein